MNPSSETQFTSSNSQKVAQIQPQQAGVAGRTWAVLPLQSMSSALSAPSSSKESKRSKIPLARASDKMGFYNISAHFCCSHLILQIFLSKPSPLSRLGLPDHCLQRSVWQPEPPISSQRHDSRREWKHLTAGIKDQTASRRAPGSGSKRIGDNLDCGDPGWFWSRMWARPHDKLENPTRNILHLTVRLIVCLSPANSSGCYGNPHTLCTYGGISVDGRAFSRCKA